MNPKTQNMWEQTGRPKTRHCDFDGCDQPTRERKPYCSDHVEQHPYIQHLLDQIAERELEEARVREVGAVAVDTRGLTAQEIIQYLRVHGDRTVKGLARELNIDVETLKGYVDALERQRLIDVDARRRGVRVISVRSSRRSRRSGKKKQHSSSPAA